MSGPFNGDVGSRSNGFSAWRNMAIESGPFSGVRNMVPFPPPCIHTNGAGLCASCQAGYDYDPSAYLEFGDHPEGLANWKREQEMMLDDIAEMEARGPGIPDPDIPF